MAERSKLNPQIDAVLGQLRSRIRRYVLLEGIALAVAFLAGLFWLSLTVDVVYFSASKLDLPLWFRQLFLVATAGVAGMAVCSWIATRLLRTIRSRALALVLERRFPELDDRLVSAVEWSESGYESESALTRSLLERTINEVSRLVEKLELGSVFNRVPLRRAAITAVVLVISIVVFGVTNASAMQRWARAFLQLEEAYWNRESAFTIQVVAQPGDVIKSFRETDDAFEYRHPRGADLTLLFEKLEGTRPDGQPWTMPQRIQLELEDREGNSSNALLTSEPYRYSVSAVQDDLTLWFQGGDFVNRKPYRIKVVDQPRINDIDLFCDYPAYTQLNELAGQTKTLQGSEIALPMETRFDLNAHANKELVQVRIQTQPELFELELTQDSGTLVVLPGSAQPKRIELTPRQLGLFWDSDSSGFKIPMDLTTGYEAKLAELTTGFERIPVSAELNLRIYLRDADDIFSLEPSRFTVRGIEDLPPIFDETRLVGISRSITRRASIPIAGLIRDDYGIENARFEYRVDDAEEWAVRPFDVAPANLPREFELQRRPDELVERFEVLPLDLQVGQRLTLTVYASDADNLNGPHVARSASIVFTIVSNEELLSMLYEREINLRRRFEQIIQEVQDKRDELQQHAEINRSYYAGLAAGPGNSDPESFQEQLNSMRNSVLTCADRSVHDVQKNHSETIEIEESFRDILAELVNNGVHTSQMVERLEALIVSPLNQVNEQDFPDVNASVYLYKQSNERQNNPAEHIDRAVQQLDDMLARMRAVLAEIKDLAEFHEALRDLKEIIDRQKQLTEQTREEQKRKILENLKKLNELNQ